MRVAPVAHQFLTKPCQPAQLQEVIERACGVKAMLREPRLIELVGRVKHLPLQPRIYGALTQMLSHPHVTVGEVARVIHEDVSLSAKVLQLVNSAFIGLPHRTSSIESAVRFIGFNLLKSLIAYCEIFEVLVGDRLEDQPDRLHNLLTAAIARELVRDPRLAEEAFTAGLFHDLGRLILNLAVPEEYARVVLACRDTRLAPHLEERARFGATAAEVGAYLLALWGIPYPVVEAVAHHPEPWRVSGQGLELPAIVHIACALAREQRSDSAGDSAFDESREYFRERGVDVLLPEWRKVATTLQLQYQKSAA